MDAGAKHGNLKARGVVIAAYRVAEHEASLELTIEVCLPSLRN
jgi:hypothetical protein